MTTHCEFKTHTHTHGPVVFLLAAKKTSIIRSKSYIRLIWQSPCPRG